MRKTRQSRVMFDGLATVGQVHEALVDIVNDLGRDCYVRVLTQPVKPQHQSDEEYKPGITNVVGIYGEVETAE